MKHFFRKISAIGTTALLTGMTMGVAAAANYPAPFVVGSASDVAIVYGAAALPTDVVQAGNIQTDLSTKLGGTGSGGTTTATGGDSLLIEKTNNKFNLMNNMSDFFTKIDDDELSNVLAEGVYSNDAHDDFDYTQEISFGAGLQLKHFLDNEFNDDEPIIGFHLSNGQHLFNYTLEFTPDDAQGVDADWGGITNTYIPILGQMYYVLSMTNTSAVNHKITLLNAAADGELSEGETTTLTTDTGTYEVSVAYIDTNSVKLTVNGVTTDNLEAGQTQKILDGVYVGIKEVNFQAVTGGSSFVSFSIGSGKLVLENTKEVEMNNDRLSKIKYDVENSDEDVTYKVNTYITTSGTDLDKIVLEWNLNDESWLAPGTDIVLPGFETVKYTMGGFVEGTAEEVTHIEGDANALTIDTTLTDGDVSLDVLALNTSSDGIQYIGKDSTHKLVTSATEGSSSTVVSINLNETEDSYFVVTWISGDDFESYAYQLSDVDETDKNKTTLQSIVTGGTDFTLDEELDTETVGNIEFQLAFAREKYSTDAYVTLNITASSSGNVYTDRFVTAEGLKCKLPVDSTIAGDGYINLTAGHPATWTMNCTEEDKDGNVEAGKSFTIAMAASGNDGFEPGTIGGGLSSTTMYESSDGSKEYIGYMPSDLATKLVHDKPSSGLNQLDITYFGSESYGEVYIAETGVVISPENPEDGPLGNVLVKDNEVSSVSTKNLIVVGGTCINTAAATALGTSPNTCGTAFTTATGVGSGEFLIKGVDGAFTEGKLALVVAGYDAQDTVNAATYLTTQTVDTSKEYKGTSGTSATMTTTTA